MVLACGQSADQARSTVGESSMIAASRRVRSSFVVLFVAMTAFVVVHGCGGDGPASTFVDKPDVESLDDGGGSDVSFNLDAGGGGDGTSGEATIDCDANPSACLPPGV